LAGNGDEENLESGERIRRGALRTITNSLLVLVALGVIAGWFASGLYELALGEEAVVLRLGSHHRTVKREGVNWHWPPPLEFAHKVNTQGVRTELYGISRPPAAGEKDPTKEQRDEGVLIQTADRNIVSVSVEVQYTVDDAYSVAYGMADPRVILREATQAAVRKVIGGTTADGVLFDERQQVEIRAREILEETLERYATYRSGAPAYSIDKINLQKVHPPEAVRSAFKDVEAAQQDRDRLISTATGDAREIMERAQAEVIEMHERSEAYKEAKILESKGEAVRFLALLTEYRRAPNVTRRRLYIETMEEILPAVQKMIIEPEAMRIVPFLQMSAPRSDQGTAPR
jgi:membrane protease subunit HflK